MSDPPEPQLPATNPSTLTISNRYIPSFISKKPFYVAESDDPATGSTSDYLEHQRLSTSAHRTDPTSKWYDRGKTSGRAATKWREGACENCGAMGHKRKDCLERPRKIGAKWSGRDIRADRVAQDFSLGWDAKRDRWNGYDPGEYKDVVEEYNALEEMKRKMKGEEEEGQRKMLEDGEVKHEGDQYEEETDMGRQQSTSTRNLRLREDTAKYLLNLDLDSAKYDPKTRSMVNSGATADQAAALVAEEGFLKASGDAAEFDRASRAAWEMQERGDKNKIHLQANPTSGEYFRKKEAEEKERKRQEQQKLLSEKYGGQENYTDKNPTNVVENERFVEYDEKGKIKGQEPVKAKSIYPEDVFINNHTSVWGSWWKDFTWGYACCHSTVKNSYCTGEEAKKALESVDRLQDPDEVPKQVAWREEAEHEEHVPNGVDGDKKARLDSNARKRTLNELQDGVSDEQMDEYRRKRIAADDPMAKHLGKDQLVM